jgi:hypothetical protein
MADSGRILEEPDLTLSNERSFEARKTCRWSQIRDLIRLSCITSKVGDAPIVLRQAKTLIAADQMIQALPE